MEAVAFEIAPNARLIHLMHGVAEFDTIAAARTLEGLTTFPVGFHVCVCDPGVGTSRHALALLVGRGDILIGPDNGVLLPAARLLGGVTAAYAIENPAFMRSEVSAIFHGRDIFTPTAAHLANGAKLSDVGPMLNPNALHPAAYLEAQVKGTSLHATVIQINRFGSIHLNVLHRQWDQMNIELGAVISAASADNRRIQLTHGRTFADVPHGKNIILRDDYGRLALARNMARLVDDFPVKVGDTVIINP